MKLHRMVNGKKVELSEEEEAELRAEWERNRVEANDKRLMVKANRERREFLKQQLAEKLSFTLEEVEILLSEKNELRRPNS